MLFNQKNLAVAATIVLGCCCVVEGGNGPGAGSPGNSPFCGPCVPERVNYGYFPTNWRRWPSGHAAPIAGQQPEALPTPAEPAMREIPETPLEPTQPDAAVPEPGDKSPLPVEPPFGEPQAMPPADTSPIELPFGEEPPPFDDAPPVLPTDPKNSTLPFDPTLPAEAFPREELPEAGTTPAPKSDLPPTMPDDDPFKDDPQPDPAPPAESPPKTSAHDEQEPIGRQASILWQRTTEAPGKLGESPALPLPTRTEPVHLETDGGKAQSPRMPGRDNPLRSASRARSLRKIVPTAGFSPADTKTAAAGGIEWRPNPLRSN